MQQLPVAAGPNCRQLGGLIQEEFFFHKSLKSRCWFLEALRETHSLPFQLLAAKDSRRLVAAHSNWASVHPWPCLLHVFSALSPWIIQNDLILTSLASLERYRSFFQIWLYSQFLGYNISFGELSFKPIPLTEAKLYKEREARAQTLTGLCFTEV